MTARPDPERARTVTPRREFGLAMLLLVAGGALVLVAAGQIWWSASWQAVDFPAVRLARTGREVAPGAWACGILALAGVVGVLATRRPGRLVTGAVVALAGLSTVIVSVAGWWMRDAQVAAAVAAAVGGSSLPAQTDQVGGSPWPALSVVGGLMVAAGGTLVCVRGHGWPAMGARYDAPRAVPATASAASTAATTRPAEPPARERTDLWNALDRGEDPTR